MKTVILTAREDEDSGELGYCLDDLEAGISFSTTTEGLIIAHDLIEHQNGIAAIGPIDDEMEALGAIWFVRGCLGELRRDHVGSMHSIEENIASDFARMCRDFLWNDERLNPPVTRALDEDETFREIISIAKREARGEIEPDEAREHADRIRQFWAACLPFMRIGYRKARKRFGDSYTANRQFWAIADALDPLLKSCEYAGQQIELTYGDGQARAWEYYGEDYE